MLLGWFSKTLLAILLLAYTSLTLIPAALCCLDRRYATISLRQVLLDMLPLKHQGWKHAVPAAVGFPVCWLVLRGPATSFLLLQNDNSSAAQLLFLLIFILAGPCPNLYFLLAYCPGACPVTVDFSSFWSLRVRLWMSSRLNQGRNIRAVKSHHLKAAPKHLRILAKPIRAICGDVTHREYV